MGLRKNTTYSKRPSHAARAAHARGAKQFSRYDTSYIKPKRSKGPVILGVVLVAVVVIALVVGVGSFLKGCSSDASLLPKGESATVVIAEGSGGNAIGQTLADAKLVTSAKDFTDRVNKLGAGKSLKPGTYVIAGGTSLDDIIGMLVDGPGMGKGVTIPEGMKLSDIASTVESATDGSVKASDFMAAASNVDSFRSSYPFLQDVTSLEGFLFPKTYELSGADTADSLIRAMLNQYQAEKSSLNYSYPSSQGLSEYGALILASIVEKESDENTRAKVAAVFYNRLGNMGDPNYGLLQSDATTAYEVGHDPTAAEVHADTPYSTYNHVGLPPTPICQPGLDALQAVCAPDQEMLDGKYYYFYFKRDASGKMQYYFSKTIEEHNAAIANA